MTRRLIVGFAALLASALAARAADEPAVQAIRQAGGQVLELAQNDPRLSVAFHLSNTELTADQLKLLAAVKDRLAVLNLRGTKLNDEMATQLQPLTELVRLHLEKTAITDAGLKNLAEMKKLEYLNLYGTAVSDAGLETIAALPALKQLYVWESQVTPQGVAKLKQTRPELAVIGLPAPAAEKPAAEKPAAEKPAAETPAS